MKRPKRKSKPNSAGITPAEFARREGVTRQTVAARIKTGMPTLSNGRIDPVAARQWCANNLRQHAPVEREAESFASARTRKENALASLREIELARARGEFVDVDELVDASVSRAHQDMYAMMTWPSRVAARMAVDLGVSEEALRPVLERFFHTFIAERLEHRQVTQAKELQ